MEEITLHAAISENVWREPLLKEIQCPKLTNFTLGYAFSLSGNIPTLPGFLSNHPSIETLVVKDTSMFEPRACESLMNALPNLRCFEGSINIFFALVHGRQSPFGSTLRRLKLLTQNPRFTATYDESTIALLSRLLTRSDSE